MFNRICSLTIVILYFCGALALCIVCGVYKDASPIPCKLGSSAIIDSVARFDNVNIVRITLLTHRSYEPHIVLGKKYVMIINNSLSEQYHIIDMYQNNSLIKVYQNCNNINPRNYYLYEHYTISGWPMFFFVHSLIHLIIVTTALIYVSCELHIYRKSLAIYNYINPPDYNNPFLNNHNTSPLWTDDDMLDDTIIDDHDILPAYYI